VPWPSLYLYIIILASKEKSAASSRVGIAHQQLVGITPMVGGAHPTKKKMYCFIEIFFLLLSFH
jgi:hypothetical protein